MRTDETAVLIAGAGLAGLMLAGDLSAAGLPVTVLGAEPDGSGHQQVTLSPRTLEQLDARGLADPLVQAGLPAHQLPLPGEVSLDLSGLPSRYPFALITPGADVARLWAGRARAAGVTFFPGTQVTSVRQVSDHVIAEVAGSRGTSCTFTASYLVGLGQPGLGRVFGLADGPGTDASLQDAANLSWKLVAVLRDRAGPELLASYASERAQAGRYAQRQAALLARLSPASLRTITRIGPVAGYAVRALAGLTLRYPAGPGQHWLTGRRAPDVWLDDGTGRRLYEALREQRLVLLAAAGPTDGGQADGGQADGIGSLLDLWAGRVLGAPATGQARLVLVRPDGYVGWASDSAAAARRYAGLRAALTRYCGPGTRTASPAR